MTENFTLLESNVNYFEKQKHYINKEDYLSHHPDEILVEISTIY